MKWSHLTVNMKIVCSNKMFELKHLTWELVANWYIHTLYVTLARKWFHLTENMRIDSTRSNVPI